MAQFDFRFKGLGPNSGWTANSIVGPVNALAQAPITAANLATTPQTLTDPTLGSRKLVNPDTGIRDVAASASVYAQPDTQSNLAQAVTGLSGEQALRRALQAEWNNRLFAGASSGGPDAFLFAEALRAASVGPGSSVAFGQAIADPAIAAAQKAAVENAEKTEVLRRQSVADLSRVQQDIKRLSSSNTSFGYDYNRAKQLSELRKRESELSRSAQSTLSRGGGGTGGGWTPRPTNSFQPGYSAAWGI